MFNEESITIMEPLLPAEGDPELENLVFELVTKATPLASNLPTQVRESVGNLVRSMNCYYSNLIEGHNTHPRDIERALAEDFSDIPEQRELQLEAKAHIEVQQLIDSQEVPDNFLSEEYICWLHQEFCLRLPAEMLVVKNPDTGEERVMVPGAIRTSGVQVGQHIAPYAKSIPKFLVRYAEGYALKGLSRVRQIIAIPASHHRLLWIHPFYDGNGRVTRLLSHAFLKKTGVGSSLWSVSRGLSRDSQTYKRLLMAADAPRHGDHDGRGSRTAKGLKAFCEFFLKTCIDQVEFMDSVLQLPGLLNRIERYSAEEIAEGRLPHGSFLLLKEALVMGEFPRGKVVDILGYKERQARTVLTKLVEQGFLVSDTPKGSVRLGFPIEVIEKWFPKLYPTSLDFSKSSNSMYIPLIF